MTSPKVCMIDLDFFEDILVSLLFIKKNLCYLNKLINTNLKKFENAKLNFLLIY